jgi:hypothetical protein
MILTVALIATLIPIVWGALRDNGIARRLNAVPIKLALRKLGAGTSTDYFLVPPLIRIATAPWILLRPRTYRDLILYYASFIPAYAVCVFVTLAHFLPPSFCDAVGETPRLHEELLAPILKLVAQRPALQLKVLREESYLVNC